MKLDEDKDFLLDFLKLFCIIEVQMLIEQFLWEDIDSISEEL